MGYHYLLGFFGFEVALISSSMLHSGPENLKKNREKLMKSKIFFHESEFLAALNFFPDQKSIFGHF